MSDANHAYLSAERERRRLLSENSELRARLYANEQEIARLEKALRVFYDIDPNDPVFPPDLIAVFTEV